MDYIIPLIGRDGVKLKYAAPLCKAIIVRALELGYNNKGKVDHTDKAIALMSDTPELCTSEIPCECIDQEFDCGEVDLHDFFWTDRYKFSDDITIADRTATLNEDGIDIGCTHVPWEQVDRINAKRKELGF